MDFDKADLRQVAKVKEFFSQSPSSPLKPLTLRTNLATTKEQGSVQGLNFHSYLITIPNVAWTIRAMRNEFKNFPNARRYFHHLYGVKANNWQTLVERVNVIETALVHLGMRIR